MILDDILTTIFYIIRNKFNNNYNNELNSVFSSSEKWLKNLYVLDSIFEKEDNRKNYKHELEIDFDFPEWLTKSDLPPNPSIIR